MSWGRLAALRYERAHAAAVRRAVAEVPFYRSGGPGPDLDTIEEVLHLLYPLAAPLRARAELPPWLGTAAELRAALELTGRWSPGRPVTEIRPALLDRSSLGPGPYRVLLSAAADRDPAAVLTEPALEGLLLGDAGELADAGPPGGVDLFLRCPLGTLAGELDGPTAEVAGRPVAGRLLHDPHLGYVGAWAPGCDRPHLSTRLVHAAATLDGPVFSKLVQRRPTLVHVRPAGLSALTVAPCPVHGRPTLLRHAG